MKKATASLTKRLLSEVVELVFKDLSSFMSNEFHSATSNMTVQLGFRFGRCLTQNTSMYTGVRRWKERV
jgi:hypothetical protein